MGQFWNDSHAEKWGKIYSGSVSQGVWSKSHWQKQRGRLQKYEARRKTLKKLSEGKDFMPLFPFGLYTLHTFSLPLLIHVRLGEMLGLGSDP